MPIKGLSVLLVTAVILSCFCACASGQNESGSVTKESAGFLSTEAETELSASIPDVDYEGYEFRVLHWYVDSWSNRLDKDIYAESENGDVLNDAVYQRNMMVTDKVNAVISLKDMETTQVPTTVRRMVSAGDDAYDLVYVRTYEVASMLTEGVFIDFNELEYCDLTMPWWDQNSVNDLSVGGKSYLAASDINVIDKDATASVVFSKKCAEENSIPDLYYLVNNGSWTIDALWQYAKVAAYDVNGDGKMGMDDTWGFIAGRDVPTAFFNGAGSRFASKDENDLPVFTFESDYNYAVTELIIELMNDDTCFYNHHTGTGSAGITDDNEYQDMFENGHGLFFWTRLDAVSSMRASDTDFGILPTPKYQETQDEYYSLVSIHTNGLMSVPVSASDLERTSVILEAMAFYSSSTVQPAYYETALKGKYIRDEESSAMLDIIIGNRVFDIGIFFQFGGFATTYETIDSYTSGAASLYASKEAKIQTDIEKIVEQVSALSE